MTQVGGKKFSNYNDAGNSALMASGVFILCVPADAPFDDGIPRGLWCGAAVTATMVDQSDTERADVPLLPGFNPFMPTKITAATGDVWLMY